MRFAPIIREIIGGLGDALRYLRIIYLRMTGMSIGKGCFISLRAKLDASYGNIVIGDKCVITHGSAILSHDAAAWRIHPKDDPGGTVRLGNRVFIGVNSVVLRNVTIGDNSIVGAGSVVTKDIPPNVVVAGNPARIIRQLSGR